MSAAKAASSKSQKTRHKVLGRQQKANRKLSANARVSKVRTFDAVQKAKRLASARYKNKGQTNQNGEAPAPPPARKFHRGSMTLN